MTEWVFVYEKNGLLAQLPPAPPPQMTRHRWLMDLGLKLFSKAILL